MTSGPFVLIDGQVPFDLNRIKDPESSLHGRQQMSLGKFREQICAMWMGVTVTREEVIMYVAHKLGGRHYDERRRGNLGVKYIALDRIRTFKTGYEEPGKKFLMDKVYFELLATRRFLTESESVQELARQLEAGR